jgi:putative membrane protein
MRIRVGRLAALCLVFVPVVAAHEGGPLHPDDLWRSWEFEPGVVVPLLVTAILYARGARASRGTTSVEAGLFWSGLVVLALALVSPLHPLGEVLFSAHMAQHEILMLAAAPPLVLARPLVPLLWGLPFRMRRRVGRWSKTAAAQTIWRSLTAPFTAWLTHAIALWVWHVPALFQATLRSEWVHTAQHLSFFLSALLFWWALFHNKGRAGYGAAVFYLFTTAIHTGILGALLTFAPVVIYPAYSATTRVWGLTALEDQQIGGLIMWVPAGVVYVTAALVLFSAWLRQSDAMSQGKSYAD